MAVGLLAQYVVVSVAVAASGVFVVQKQWPASVRRLRIACALPLVRDARPAWLRKFGLWIAPSTMKGAACGNDSCGGCSH